jgi:hypothetical protein
MISPESAAHPRNGYSPLGVEVVCAHIASHWRMGRGDRHHRLARILGKRLDTPLPNDGRICNLWRTTKYQFVALPRSAGLDSFLNRALYNLRHQRFSDRGVRGLEITANLTPNKGMSLRGRL